MRQRPDPLWAGRCSEGDFPSGQIVGHTAVSAPTRFPGVPIAPPLEEVTETQLGTPSTTSGRLL